VTRKTKAAAALMMSLSLVAAACGSDSKTTADTTAKPVATTAAPKPTDAAPVVTDAAPTSEAAPTIAAAPVTEPAPAGFDATKWALDYTGGKGGEASGDPFVIGYVNQEDFFPEATIGINAAVEFANKELGGIDGRPIELDFCKVTAEEDGQKCATQFLNNDKISFVMTGTLLFGADSLYKALDGKKPVVIGNGVTTADFLTTAGYGFTTGSIGVIPGIALFASTGLAEKPKKAAVVYSDNPAGQAAFNSLLKPVFDGQSVEVTGVAIGDAATGPEVAAAMQAAGADTADVFVPLVTIQGCIATYDAISSLGITPTVLTTGLCFGTPMTDHLKELGVDGQVPDGWYFGGYGYSYFMEGSDPGMDTYVAKIQEYGKKAPGAATLEYTGFGGPMFATMMTVLQLGNKIGADKIEPLGFRAAMEAFSGPQMLQVGPIACGKTVVFKIPFVAICGSQMGIQQYKDGAWTAIADGTNGKAVDVTKI
jgi:branched-chain amino acid transport system substrate-binding protein